MTKKYDKGTALAKIKVLINDFYQRLGREEIDGDVERKELIDSIDDILDQTDIPGKNLIIESLEDAEIRKSLKEKW